MSVMGLGKALVSGLARLFGLSLVELAKDREAAGEQLADAAASAADDETLVDVLVDDVDRDVLLDALELDRDELVDAGEDTFELIAGAARPVDDSVDATDNALEYFAEQLGRDPDDVFWRPVEAIQRIPDRRDETYIWILRDDVDRFAFADTIDAIFRENFGRDPRGLHIPLNEVEEIRLAPPDELRTYVAPQIERVEQNGQQPALEGGE